MQSKARRIVRDNIHEPASADDIIIQVSIYFRTGTPNPEPRNPKSAPGGLGQGGQIV